ncbi:hypothetical protein ACFVTF_05755 [Kitasatospora sp. NPDC057940]|uniref:hypothetical protein n=1 Tax=Kitasatospora sp. NPDC057940 TaxID=3346285 RepID=UPI0036DC2D57
MATAAVGCLVLLSLTAPVSSAQAPAGRKRDVVYDPVHLVQDDSGRGVTFEVYDNWDYALLTNAPGNGTVVVFILDHEGNYSIASTSAWSAPSLALSRARLAEA